MSFDIRALEEASKQVEEQRGKIQDLLEKRGHVFFQQKECEIVLEEFEFLNETDVVMKQCGPALVVRDLAMAKDEVETNLSAVKEQMKLIEKSIEEEQKKMNAAQQKLDKLQSMVK